ncbi:MAG: glycosyltransferase [Lachnospiraceae bacterium]|nr:glycosyltransferase [Candidatus Colinaster scatohippi]
MKKTPNDRKRIAFYIGSLGKGGAERVIRNLALFFYEQGYDVFMVTKLREEVEYELRPEITRIIADITDAEDTGKRLGNLLARIKKLKEIWKEIKPDIIVSFIRKNNLMAIASAMPLKIPVVVSVRSAPERELAGKGVKQLTFAMFGRAAGIVLQTTQAMEYFPKRLQKKAVILPNSINREFAEYLDNMGEVSQGNKTSDFRVITVGRIDDNKNQKMLVEAFVQVCGSDSKWTLHLYGDGESRQKVEAIAKASNVADKIVFHGVVDNIPEEMSKADIFVLPSKVEGMPNALIEAMAMGKACISTDCPCGGPADLIENEVSGILIRVDDKEGLARALAGLMEDADRRQALGIMASDIRKRLAPTEVNRKWQEYIESIIG